MSESKCPKCSSTGFEMVTSDKVKGSKLKINFIRCSSCGTVVGVRDYFDIATLLSKIAKKLGVNIY